MFDVTVKISWPTRRQMKVERRQRGMEPLTLDGNARGNVEHVVHQVFQDLLETETASQRFCDVDISDSCKLKIENYANAVEEIENVEKKVREVEAKQIERIKKIQENTRATELIKLKRQPFYTDLKGELAEKYALLESSDLLPEISEDFRTNEMARERWKRRIRDDSKDSLFVIPEVSPKPKADTMIHENIRKEKKVKSDHSIARSTASHATSLRKPRRSIMRTETQKIILVAQPNHVKFSNFEPRKIYRRTVLLKNVSNAVAKFQLETRARSKFSIALESRSGDRENLAPGMNLRMIILFNSDDGDDSEERIVVKVEFGKPIFVIVSAYRDPPILKGTNIRLSNYEATTLEESISFDIDTCESLRESSEDRWHDFAENPAIFSSETSESNYVYLRKNDINLCGSVSYAHLECKRCFVGEKIVVKTRFKNVGGEGRFFAMSEFDWNSMSIDSVTTENSLILPCFAIWPSYFALKRNEEVDLLTYFFPDSRGLQVDKILMVCDNLAMHSIELIGDGDVYEPGIVIFDENVEENVRFEQNEEECCDYSLNMGFDVSNVILKNSITVSNTSGLEIYYRWEKRSTNVTEMRNRVQTWKDLPLDFLTVFPNSGFFRPCSSITFEIAVELTNLTANFYRVVLQLFIEDIPIAAIAKEYEERLENSREKRRLCETSKDIRTKEIELWARCIQSTNFERFSSSSISLEAIENSDERIPQRRSFSA